MVNEAPATAAVRTFARRVKRLRRVLAVFASGCEHRQDVLTLLDGDHRRMARGLVYDAEREALLAHPDAALHFRVIDWTEHLDQEPRDLIPTDYEIVWAREPERLAAALGR